MTPEEERRLERARDALGDARVTVCSWAELVTEARAAGDRAAVDRLLTRLAEAVAGERAAAEALGATRDAIRAARVV